MTTLRPPGVGVLLAGGAGTRFAGPSHKLLTEFRGRPLVQWGVDAIRAAGLRPWIVWGHLAPVAPDLGADVVVLQNADWAEGMATSLAVAVDRARAEGLETLTVGPADQPMVPAEAWRRVAAAPRSAPIVVATYGGVRANPVRLGAEVWDLLPRTGDTGARDLIRLRKDLVVEVACPGTPADIDTLEDLRRWNS